MTRRRWAIALLAAAPLGACGELLATEIAESPDGAAVDAAPAADADAGEGEATTDAKTGCDLLAPFTSKVMLGELPADFGDLGRPSLTRDELVITYGQGIAGFIATRTSKSAPFGPPRSLDELGPGWRNDPSLSEDGLSVYFTTERDTGGSTTIWFATRSSRDAVFFAPSGVPVLNLPASNEFHAFVEGVRGLWFVRDNTGSGREILFSARMGAALTAPVDVPSLSSSVDDDSPVVSADGHVMYFASERPGGAGGFDIYVAQRSDPLQPAFGAIQRVSELATAVNEAPGWLSEDGCRLYYTSNFNLQRSRIWLASRSP